LLYAHWEGFVKAASEAYIAFVACRRLKHAELSYGFLALSLRKRLLAGSKTEDPSAQIELARFILSISQSRAEIPKDEFRGTGSNLSSQRLKSIVLILGLDYDPFQLKEKWIDERLLKIRNEVAHGRSTCPSESDFDELYAETTDLIREFKDQVSNAVYMKKYRSSIV